MSGCGTRGEERILLFGGTTEGRELAVELARRGWTVVVCVATQTGAEQLPSDDARLDVRTGRLGAEAMAALMDEGFYQVVDATHPYATAVSANVREAAGRAGIPYLRVLRPRIDYGDCPTAGSVEEACGMVSADGGNVLAATGNKEIAAYTVIEGYRERVFARVLPDPDSVESCREVGLPDDHIIAAQGPFSVQENREIIDGHAIRFMITKESGALGGFPEKLQAARETGCTLIIVRRPVDEDGVMPEEVPALLGTPPDGLRDADGEGEVL